MCDGRSGVVSVCDGRSGVVSVRDGRNGVVSLCDGSSGVMTMCDGIYNGFKSSLCKQTLFSHKDYYVSSSHSTLLCLELLCKDNTKRCICATLLQKR